MEKEHVKHHAKPSAKKHPVKHHDAGKAPVRRTRPKKEKSLFTNPIIILCALAVVVMIFNQFQINSLSSALENGVSVRSSGNSVGRTSASVDKSLESIDLSQLKSTGHTLAAVFPVEDIQTSEDALAIMFPTGTPDYGADLGVSYDDPVGSLSTLARMYRGLKAEVQKNDPEAWQRYMNLASKPVGISCEYCCGVGPIGINSQGDSACGCQHNPAVLSVALYLSAYSDYSDGEILREVMRWKTLFFPKNMIELGTSLAGGDTSALDNLPGMVGGC